MWHKWSAYGVNPPSSIFYRDNVKNWGATSKICTPNFWIYSKWNRKIIIFLHFCTYITIDNDSMAYYKDEMVSLREHYHQLQIILVMTYHQRRSVNFWQVFKLLEVVFDRKLMLISLPFDEIILTRMLVYLWGKICLVLSLDFCQCMIWN